MITRPLTTEDEWLAAYSVMKQLRPHLASEQQFVQQLSRMVKQGYVLLALFDHDIIVGLAGYRLQENLLYGQFLYVDDLVIKDTYRSQGLGSHLLKAVMAIAQQHQCVEFVLDTGLHMATAQRFYFSQGLLTQAIRFRNLVENLL